MVKVTIYSTISCQYCLLAKRYLEQNNIPFTEVDVTFDEAKQAELVAKAGENRTPVFIIERDGREEVLSGFDKGKLDELLGIKKQ
jgi:glutaredoxin 3